MSHVQPVPGSVVIITCPRHPIHRSECCFGLRGLSMSGLKILLFQILIGWIIKCFS